MDHFSFVPTLRPRRARRRVDRRGFALPLALLLCLAIGSVAWGAAALSLTGQRIAANFDAFNRALDVAEAGLSRGAEWTASTYESGAVPPDSATLVVSDSLSGFAYTVRVDARREPPSVDLNGNGVVGETVRYDRSWGYEAAAAAGVPAQPGEPVRVIRSTARGNTAQHELLLEVGLERDLDVAGETTWGAWRVIPLRWSSLEEL